MGADVSKGESGENEITRDKMTPNILRPTSRPFSLDMRADLVRLVVLGAVACSGLGPPDFLFRLRLAIRGVPGLRSD
jgi:hypothetical protein